MGADEWDWTLARSTKRQQPPPAPEPATPPARRRAQRMAAMQPAGSGAAGGDRLPRRKALAVYPVARALIARHTWPLVAGMARSRTPSGASASTTAFMTAAGAPIVPASPQPLAPSGLCAHSVA
jgi:hypothetical protein